MNVEKFFPPDVRNTPNGGITVITVLPTPEGNNYSFASITHPFQEYTLENTTPLVIQYDEDPREGEGQTIRRTLAIEITRDTEDTDAILYWRPGIDISGFYYNPDIYPKNYQRIHRELIEANKIKIGTIPIAILEDPKSLGLNLYLLGAIIARQDKDIVEEILERFEENPKVIEFDIDGLAKVLSLSNEEKRIYFNGDKEASK